MLSIDLFVEVKTAFVHYYNAIFYVSLLINFAEQPLGKETLALVSLATTLTNSRQGSIPIRRRLPKPMSRCLVMIIKATFLPSLLRNLYAAF